MQHNILFLITGPPTNSVGGAKLVTVAGICHHRHL